MSTPPIAAHVWLDDFFAAYYRRRPVNATFIGMHDYDDRLPDVSASGVDETVAEMQSLLHTLRAGAMLPPTSDAEAIDLRLAEHFLTIQLWEFASGHSQRGNPCMYTGEATFGVLSLFLRPFAPLAERVAAAIARMEAIPNFLHIAAANVRSAPPEWTERAIRECTGAMHFLGNGIDMLMADEGITVPRFRDAARKARAAFAEYQTFLASAVHANPTDGYGCGGEAFEMYMHLGHELDTAGDEIERYAREQFAESQAALVEGARTFGTSDWRTITPRRSSIIGDIKRSGMSVPPPHESTISSHGQSIPSGTFRSRAGRARPRRTSTSSSTARPRRSIRFVSMITS